MSTSYPLWTELGSGQDGEDFAIESDAMTPTILEDPPTSIRNILFSDFVGATSPRTAFASDPDFGTSALSYNNILFIIHKKKKKKMSRFFSLAFFRTFFIWY